VYPYNNMKYLTPLFLFVAVTVPQYIFAAEDEFPDGVVTCKEGGNCSFCDLAQTIQNVTLWITFVAMLIAVLIIMYAGYKITASRGDVSMVTDGRKLIGNVAIGVFIVVLAVTIIDVLLKATTGGGFGVWNEPECPEPFTIAPAVDVNVGLKKNPGIIIAPDPDLGQGSSDAARDWSQNGGAQSSGPNAAAGEGSSDAANTYMQNGGSQSSGPDASAGEGSSDAARDYIQNGGGVYVAPEDVPQ
jgi:hypothetical protein